MRLRPRVVERGLVARPRLVDALRRRWDVRICAVTAGPGFGKSAALAAAVHERTRPPDAHDHWLTCDPGDEDADHLGRAVAEALGCPPSVDAAQTARWMWRRAPTEVCLVLDDVHRIGEGTSGARWLAELAEAMPANGHLVTASRRPLPFGLHRWAANGELVRIDEDDLRFDDDELAAYARQCAVPRSLLDGAGGWPALVALRAHAGSDLVDRFLWDEVLANLSADRVQGLAQLQLVGGADRELVGALTGGAHDVASLLGGVPLAERRAGGWVALHALWGPVLEGQLSLPAAEQAVTIAIDVHRRRGRIGAAVELAIRARRWDDVLDLLRAVALDVGDTPPSALARWYQSLPVRRRSDPVAWMVAGIEQEAREPRAAVASFERAAAGLRRRGDDEAELVALSYLGLHAWWENDIGRLLDLVQRVDELHDRSVPGAAVLHRIGRAGAAHLVGDPGGVLAELAEIPSEELGPWLTTAHWLEAVAHRRLGELEAAEAALEVFAGLPDGRLGPQVDVARLRARWLAGRVDEVLEGLARAVDHFERLGDRYLLAEVGLDLAAKRALVGDLDTAEALIERCGDLRELPGSLVRVLDVLARAALFVGRGDEVAAADLLRTAREPALSEPWAWYWSDRAGLALAYVLRPEVRPAVRDLPLPPVLGVGVDLGRAMVAARDGDAELLKASRWPAADVIRTHLPVRWIVELAEAARRAGNPLPAGLVRRVTSGHSPVVALSVLGPLRVVRDGAEVEAPELRRRRVRELLCSLVAEPRRRRAALAEELWPDAADPMGNLRVNLSHLQRALEPERQRHVPPAIVLADATWLTLVPSSRLVVDAWELIAEVDGAEAAERAGDVEGALDGYLRAIARWRGEPFVDVDDAAWVHPAREELRRRHVSAAVRASELLLAAGEPARSRRAAERALAADPQATAAHRLLVRTLLAEGDEPGARRAARACDSALAELGLPPDPTVAALLR